MAIDDRYSLHSFEGQRSAVQDLFVKYIEGRLDHEIVKGATTLIREARMILQAEIHDKKTRTNPAMKKTVKKPTPNGPFPRLIKPN
jgi:hypothetical protein